MRPISFEAHPRRLPCAPSAAGRRGLVDHQRLSGSGYCFSASCPPSACSGAARGPSLPAARQSARLSRVASHLMDRISTGLTAFLV